MKSLTVLTLIYLLIFLPSAAFAQTYSDASLNGTYVFQISNPLAYGWSKTFSCPTNSTATYTVYGSVTTQQVTTGTATANGSGTISITQTVVGAFNATASANTTSVTWNSACQVTKVNNGHVVYAAASTTTVAGTYTVQSNGSGTLTNPGGTLNFQLTGTNSSGIATTVMLVGKVINGQSIGAGIAVHE